MRVYEKIALLKELVFYLLIFALLACVGCYKVGKAVGYQKAIQQAEIIQQTDF